MIEYKRGNLLEADTEAIVNPVNCVGVMGKGVAFHVKRRFPGVYREYEAWCRAGKLQPGVVFSCLTGIHAPKYVINFPTKYHWRDESYLSTIQLGLLALSWEIRRLGIDSISIPALGCGNGGLDWADVQPKIEATFKASDARVVIYEPLQTAVLK